VTTDKTNEPINSATDQFDDDKRDMANEILNAAKEIVRRVGFEKFKLANVARDVGITIPAIYHHFPSRGALLDAIRADNLLEATAYFGNRQQRLFEAIKNQDHAEFDAINYDFNLSMSNNEHLNSWGNVAEILLSQKNTQFAEAVREAISKSIQIDVDIVQEAQKIGWIDSNIDPNAVVALALAYCIGLAVVRRIPTLQEKREAIDKTATDLAITFSTPNSN